MSKVDQDRASLEKEVQELRASRARLHATINDRYDRLSNLGRLYPPDGGGRAFDARSTISQSSERLKEINARLEAVEQELQRSTEQDRESYLLQEVETGLERGYSTHEIARDLRLTNLEKLVPRVSRVALYERWSHQGLAREVLVWRTNDSFEVRYFSMTEGGRHSRLVGREVFADEETAIQYAEQIRRSH